MLLSLTIKIPAVEAVDCGNVTNAGVYRFKVGSYKVATISDGLLKLPPLPTYAPTADPQEVEKAMIERFWSPNELALYFNAIYVDTGTHKVLIDTGAGLELGADLQNSLRIFVVQASNLKRLISSLFPMPIPTTLVELLPLIINLHFRMLDTTSRKLSGSFGQPQLSTYQH